MSNKNSNFPTNELNHLGEGVSSEIVDSLRELNTKGKPETLQELQQRINDYFVFCSARDFRPGIESLALALSVTRQALWQWCGGSRGEQWAAVCQNARQFIISFLEECTLKGRLNPASSIFYLKNWASYRDVVEVEPATQKPLLTAEQLPNLRIAGNDGGTAGEEQLPELGRRGDGKHEGK